MKPHYILLVFSLVSEFNFVTLETGRTTSLSDKTQGASVKNKKFTNEWQEIHSGMLSSCGLL